MTLLQVKVHYTKLLFDRLSEISIW